MRYILENKPDNRSSAVIIGKDALKELGKFTAGYSKVALIADASVAKIYGAEVMKILGKGSTEILIPPGEDTKSLVSAEAAARQLRENGFDRKSLLVGLGGGVANDMAGFVASIYMRGMDWVMLPTTLTAQADASIGGKTGVNLGGYKNMVGSFWPPKAVLISPDFLKTLPREHLINGLAEIIKMGFIRDKRILEHVLKINLETLLGRELDAASELAAKAKIEIVNNDLYEKGERKLLNFGHSVGHALESVSMKTKSPLLHGQAIAIGMVAETTLAELENVCPAGTVDKIVKLLDRFGLPYSYGDSSYPDILNRVAADKKNVGHDIRWTLPTGIGRGTYDYVAEAANIEKAIRSVISK